jgi:ribosomal peptide maturation radical SAM protein 1
MASRSDVLLAVLPFAAVSQPTIGVSILKAAAQEAGFSASVRYFSLDFAGKIGPRLYGRIAGFFGSRSLVGDWVFAEPLYGNRLPNADRYLAHLRADYSRWEDGTPYGVRFSGDRTFTQFFEQDLWPELLEARKAACESVDEWAEEILARQPSVVGFTSTGQQATSCLAVARRLKKSPQSPVIIFGGPNCHEEMGWHWLRYFPWIDYVCTGEGDEAFPGFLRRILRRDDSPPIPGILGRKENTAFSIPQPVRDLDKTPIPDYSDYFEQLERSGIGSQIETSGLPFETSRGCWWGEKCQCVFCGNDRTCISYRSKSASRVVREARYLAGKYRVSHFDGVDDALDREHVGTVFGKLAKRGLRLSFYFQTRPELSRNELRTLLDGGVKLIEPGIESLSDAVLRLMRKGTTGLRNVQLLRWCPEIGMKVAWRILYGFPGEPLAEYERMAKLIPLLTHLTPPLGVVLIALKRFSPLWLNSHHYGLTEVQPWPSYSYVYPFGRRKLDRIAYFFDFQYADERQPFEYSRPLRREVGTWIELWQTPDGSHPRLDLRLVGDEVVITDTRPCAVRRRYHLRGLAAKIYMECDSVQSLDALLRRFRSQASDDGVKKSLRTLVANKLMIADDGRYLSLAVTRAATSD